MAQSLNRDQYVTGMTVVARPNGGPSCPPIVWRVAPDTPAGKAGIKPGDVLFSIDGHRNIDMRAEMPLLRTTDAKPRTVELEREKGRYTVEIGRIKFSELFGRQGLKHRPDGSLFPSDATDRNAEGQQDSVRAANR